MAKKIIVLVLAAMLVSSCKEKKKIGEGEQGGEAMEIKVSSSVFEAGGTIPSKYTCDGQDVSPPVRWSAGPEGTESYALICDDPDAPGGTWVHWVIYGIPAEVRQLMENVGPERELANGARQGVNDFQRVGYGGPCPPRGGPHRYFFKVYALDSKLELAAGLRKDGLLKEMEGHILAKGELMGRYSRQ